MKAFVLDLKYLDGHITRHGRVSMFADDTIDAQMILDSAAKTVDGLVSVEAFREVTDVDFPEGFVHYRLSIGNGSTSEYVHEVKKIYA